METLNKTKDTKKIFLVTCVMLLAAAFVSFGSSVFADEGEAVASYASAGSTIVKGSENIPRISVKQFAKNIGKNTGVYKFIHTETEEEKAIAQAEKEKTEALEAADPFAGKRSEEHNV